MMGMLKAYEYPLCMLHGVKEKMNEWTKKKVKD